MTSAGLAHDELAETLARVRRYLEGMLALHDAVADAGLYPEGQPVLLSAGGSAFFDEVVAVLAPRRDPEGRSGRVIEVVLRSGAYITHDDGYYSRVTPFSRLGGEGFRAAIHGWATVVSRPQPGLALVDAGKRDLPYDDGLPVPQAVRPFGASAAEPLTITVYSAAGTPLQSFTGTSSAGANKWQWNGKDSNGIAQPDGAYNVTVKTMSGNNIESPVPFTVTGIVTTVQNQNGAGQLQMGGLTVPFSAVQSVGG